MCKLKVYQTIEQGTDEWLTLRAGKITASRCKDARDYKQLTKAQEKEGRTRGDPSAKLLGYAAQVAVERIAGRPIDQGFESWQMREGHTQEPECRAAYEAATGNLVQEVGAIATDDDVFLYSPDGLCGEDGLVEIKSLFSGDRIVGIVGGDDIADFVDQCNFGLWLTGRKWIDLCIWVPALSGIGLSLTVHRIERDENAIEALESDLMLFAQMVDEFERKLRAKAALPIAVAAIESAQSEHQPPRIKHAVQEANDSATATPQKPANPTLDEIGIYLSRMTEIELVRTLHFLQSRFPLAAPVA